METASVSMIWAGLPVPEDTLPPIDPNAGPAPTITMAAGRPAIDARATLTVMARQDQPVEDTSSLTTDTYRTAAGAALADQQRMNNNGQIVGLALLGVFMLIFTITAVRFCTIRYMRYRRDKKERERLNAQEKGNVQHPHGHYVFHKMSSVSPDSSRKSSGSSATSSQRRGLQPQRPPQPSALGFENMPPSTDSVHMPLYAPSPAQSKSSLVSCPFKDPPEAVPYHPSPHTPTYAQQFADATGGRAVYARPVSPLSPPETPSPLFPPVQRPRGSARY